MEVWYWEKKRERQWMNIKKLQLLSTRNLWSWKAWISLAVFWGTVIGHSYVRIISAHQNKIENSGFWEGYSGMSIRYYIYMYIHMYTTSYIYTSITNIAWCCIQKGICILSGWLSDGYIYRFFFDHQSQVANSCGVFWPLYRKLNPSFSTKTIGVFQIFSVSPTSIAVFASVS